MSYRSDIQKELKKAKKLGFKIKSCKSGIVKVTSPSNNGIMYSMHIGRLAVGPIKDFINKNKPK